MWSLISNLIRRKNIEIKQKGANMWRFFFFSCKLIMNDSKAGKLNSKAGSHTNLNLCISNSLKSKLLTLI